MFAESHPLYVQLASLQSVVSGGLDGEKKCIAVSEPNNSVFLCKHCMYFKKPAVGNFWHLLGNNVTSLVHVFI